MKYDYPHLDPNQKAFNVIKNLWKYIIHAGDCDRCPLVLIILDGWFMRYYFPVGLKRTKAAE